MGCHTFIFNYFNWCINNEYSYWIISSQECLIAEVTQDITQKYHLETPKCNNRWSIHYNQSTKFKKKVHNQRLLLPRVLYCKHLYSSFTSPTSPMQHLLKLCGSPQRLSWGFRDSNPWPLDCEKISFKWDIKIWSSLDYRDG